MKRKVWILPHTHYDAEVFLVEKDTLEIGYANLVGALRLLREERTFRFALDQTCYIEPFLKAYPEERATLQRFIDEGRLEIVGGMHSMPDENIPSGESFIRNVLYAKRFCAREFGVDVRGGWPIDTFGHHPQIPQLMAQCGFDYAAFQRLMRKDSPTEFYWQGLDGTRLFCHWMPCSYAAFYGAPGNLPEFRQFAEPRLERLAARAVTSHLVAPEGADLTPVEPQLLAMIAAYNRSQSEYELCLATPTECLQAIQASGEFPTITDDLNPVFQGCYSARIEVKQWNRCVETTLINAEKYAAVVGRLGNAPQGAAQDASLWAAWREVLFNQAHDIICGCHVDAVFAHTMERFKYAQTTAQGCLESSLQDIAAQVDTSGAGVPILVFNPLSWERADVVECSVAFSEADTFELVVTDAAGRVAPSDVLQAERYENGALKRATVLFIAQGLPAFGYEVYRVTRAEHGASCAAPASDLTSSHPYGGLLRFELDHGWLENAFFRLEFDLWQGVMTSIYDKTNQWEVLPEDLRLGNMVVKERDFGNFWQYNGPCKGDAFYPMEGRYPLPAFDANHTDWAHTCHGDGNIRHGNAMIEFNINHPFGSGHVGTRVRLYAGIPRIDIQTTLLNNDERVRYRAAIPTSIPSGTITYEIPFGAIARPEGEFPAQNWVDYTGGERGVTLLNRGLPGNNVVDGVMLLSLLKCTALKEGYGEVGGFRLGTPTDGGYEKGKIHSFDYALVPHAGDWRAAQAYRRGAEFNTPLIACKSVRHPGKLSARMSFLTLSGANTVLSAVMTCPEGLVVRVYEAEGRQAEHVILESIWPVQRACQVNLIEKDEKPISLEQGSHRISLALGPFEIKTIKLVF